MHDDMMVGAFSHSTAVGKLRQELPDVPKDARINFPRYSFDEAATVSYYYLRYVHNIYLLQLLCVTDNLSLVNLLHYILVLYGPLGLNNSGSFWF